MLKIVVESEKVHVKEGVGRKSKEPYKIREQEAFAFLTDRDGNPSKYPVPITVPLEDDAKPYGLGEYTAAASSFMAGDFGQLRIGRLRLAAVAKK